MHACEVLQLLLPLLPRSELVGVACVRLLLPVRGVRVVGVIGVVEVVGVTLVLSCACALGVLVGVVLAFAFDFAFVFGVAFDFAFVFGDAFDFALELEVEGEGVAVFEDAGVEVEGEPVVGGVVVVGCVAAAIRRALGVAIGLGRTCMW